MSCARNRNTDSPWFFYSSTSVEHYLTTSGDLQQCKVELGESSWETLPTLHNVVDGLKSLKLGKVREAAVQKLKGASDCSTNKRVEW